MMSARSLVLLPSALAVVLSLSCRPRTAVPLSVPDWTQGETSRYLILTAGDTAGYQTFTLGPVDLGGHGGLGLWSVTELRRDGSPVVDSVMLEMQWQDLRPLRGSRKVHWPDSTGRFGVSYSRGGGRPRVRHVGPQGAWQVELDSAPDVYDCDQLTTLLRAVALRVGSELKLRLVVVTAGSMVAATARRLPDETVTVPAGTFDCRRYDVEVDGESLAIWYDARGTHRMVRHEARVAGTTTELLPDAGAR